MKKQKTKQLGVVVYRAKNGAIELRADASQETIWATQKDIARIFGVTPQNITIHLKRIFKQGELKVASTCKESLQVQTEGKRKIKRKLKEYNLDVLIAVGYRINSVVGTKFRQWATKTLRKHIVDGYTINPKRLENNYEQFLRAVEDVKKLLPADLNIGTSDVMELIKMFASTWFSLDAYDKSKLPKSGMNKKQVEFATEELWEALAELKKDLLRKKETTELFAQEKRSGNLDGIVGSVFQSVFGKDAYPTLEEKAAHLLYFVVKNHPFTDGNKRSGAFAFVWFLRQVNILNISKFTPETLTALTLLIAESNPKEKSRMIGLVLLLLKGTRPE